MTNATDDIEFTQRLNDLRGHGQEPGAFIRQPKTTGAAKDLAISWGRIMSGAKNDQKGEGIAAVSLFVAAGVSREILPPVEGDLAKDLDAMAFSDVRGILVVSDQFGLRCAVVIRR